MVIIIRNIIEGGSRSSVQVIRSQSPEGFKSLQALQNAGFSLLFQGSRNSSLFDHLQHGRKVDASPAERQVVVAVAQLSMQVNLEKYRNSLIT